MDHGETTGPVILQVLPSLVTGGAERGCVDVAAAVVEAGGTALVASAGGPMVRELVRAEAEHVPMPLDSKRPWTIRRNARRIAEVIGARGVDIVHARSRAPAWSAYLACRATGTPFVTTFHAPYGITSPLKRWYNSVMARGDRMIAISDHVRRYIATNYSVDTSKIRVIPRGIDFDLFAPDRVSAERIVQLARRWRLVDGMPVILMPARLTRWKGQMVLLEALARLGRQDLRCVLVGSSQGRAAYRRELERRTVDLGLGGVVRIDEECSDMPAAYMLSDVVVHASTDPEGFGRVIVEAQAMGRPVIASNLGAPPETVLHGQTGWLTAPGDAAMLTEALSIALSLLPEERSEMAERGIAFVREHFGRRQMTDATINVYDELLADRMPAADCLTGP